MRTYRSSGWLILQDIAGYTAFSENLRKQGKKGVEELTYILNNFYEGQEKIVEDFGGFIFKLAGDAFFAAVPCLKVEKVKRLNNLLLKNSILKRYGLRSRVIAVKGNFGLHIIKVSGGKDIVPSGSLVERLMVLEDMTGAEEVKVDEKEDCIEHAGGLNRPVELRTLKTYKMAVSYRPQVVTFLRLKTSKIEVINKVANFILDNVPYAYLSKIVPYTHGFMLVLFYGFPKSTGKEKDLAILSSFRIKEFLNKEKISYGLGTSYDFVYTGIVGGKHFRELTFIGDGINIAARLAGLSEKDIYITREIAENVEHGYHLRERGKIKLKGRKELVGVYEVIGKESERAASGVFVDREKEKNLLKNAILNGEKLLIEGEAGIGKSRLLFEILSGSNSSSYVIIRGVPEQPPLSALRALVGALKSEILRQYPVLCDVLKNDSAKQVFRENISSIVAVYLRKALIQSGIRVVAVDDLHWLDSVSFRIIKRLMEYDKPGFIATSRSEYSVNLRVKGLKVLSLSSLSYEHSRELIEKLLKSSITDSMAKTLYERSLGIPFLIEQFTKYVKDKNLVEIRNNQMTLKEKALYEIPIDAFSLILARFDLLPESEKMLITVASCIGNEFVLDDIKSIVGKKYKSSLRVAVESGFIKDTGKGIYAFAHSLLRETIYASILGKKRIYIHLKLARIFVKKGYDTFEIAWHYKRGGALKKADIYWEKTFDRLLSSGFHREAEDILKEIRDRFIFEFSKAKLFLHYGRYSEAERLVMGLLKRARKRKRARLLLLLSSIYDFWGKYNEMKRVLKLLERCQKYLEREEVFLYKEAWGIYYDMTGDKRKALKIYRETLKYARTPVEISTAYYNIGWIYFSENKYGLAEKYFKKSIETNPDDRLSEAWCLLRLGQIEFSRDNMEKTRFYLEDSLSKFIDSGYSFGIGLAIRPLVALYIRLNEQRSLAELKDKLSATYNFTGDDMIHLYLGFMYFGDKKRAEEVWRKMGQSERMLAQIIWLSVEGKLEESYRICKQHEFKFGWCINLRSFFRETNETYFMKTDILLKALYADISTAKEERELKDAIKYWSDIPANAILIEKLKKARKI